MAPSRPRIPIIATIATALLVATNLLSLSQRRAAPRRPDAVAIQNDNRRKLFLNLDEFRDPKTVRLRLPAANVENDGHAAANLESGGGEVAPAPAAREFAPYSIDDALVTARAFRYTLFFFVYDSASDTFVAVHNAPGCDYGCQRIYRVASVVAHALRRGVPERFRGPRSSGDLVAVISTGDSPRIRQRCLLFDPGHCGSAGFAPVLQFGSVFADPSVLPSAIAMPLPVRPHITCFEEWQSGGGGGRGCQDLRPKPDPRDARASGLVFGEEMGLVDGDDYWEALTPQVVWRGTDFGFLHTMFPKMRAPSYELDIAPREGERVFSERGLPPEEDFDRQHWVINTLLGMGSDELLPRWRGVLLSSQAELDSRERARATGEDPELPWANIKFASFSLGGQKVPATENHEYQRLQRLGVAAAGEPLTAAEHAGFRYHVDIGGGGGTTWTGTVEKLALPGLLFHHVTPARDWFHDLLVPWTHYVPVAADLSDLREGYDWAEAHQAEARRIAEEATALVRWMGSAEGFARLYDEYLAGPLRGVAGAYRPPPPKYAGRSALDVIGEKGVAGNWTAVARCSGLHANSCQRLV